MRLLFTMGRLCGFLAGLVGANAAIEQAAAQAPPQKAALTEPRVVAVLELYTSQGCSSCPAADALFETYTQRRDVIALTFPVDYWDYLGWKDTLAQAKFTARQKYYSKYRGDGRVYTPQVVVNGVSHVVGSSARDIDQAITATAPAFAKSLIPVTAKLEDGRIVIDTGAAPTGIDAKDATVWLAIIQTSAEVVVRGGENRGKTLKYFNVVRELTPVGMWSGKPITIKLDVDTVKLPHTHCAAVIIQAGKAGPIIGAALIPKL